MATLPERKPCSMCGNLTRYTLDNGTPRCGRCQDKVNETAEKLHTYQYPVRMPTPCASLNCFNRALSGQELCFYHKHNS